MFNEVKSLVDLNIGEDHVRKVEKDIKYAPIHQDVEQKILHHIKN